MRRHAAGLLASLAAAAAQAAGIDACADAAGMPPFIYAAGSGPQYGEVEAAGVAVELLKLIAEQSGWQLHIDLLPWSRCMRDASRSRYAIVLNVGPEEAQANQLLVSKPYFQLHGAYLYARQRYPQGLAVTSVAELLASKLCGMGGRRFEAFGIPSERVDRGTTQSFEQLVTKLQLGRCDIVVGTREEVAGMYFKSDRLRAQIADGSLKMEPLPKTRELKLHFGVPESLPNAAALLQSLNDGLIQLERRNTVARLIEQQLGE
jgi:polar amino acid transport system substrate-binding protein